VEKQQQKTERFYNILFIFLGMVKKYNPW